MNQIKLRKLQARDLDDYLHWNDPERAFHKYNGPYFKQKTREELESFVEQLRVWFAKGIEDVLEKKELIVDAETDALIGQVNWYWKSEETLWMEVGIVIFNEHIGERHRLLRARNVGTKLFDEHPELVRIGLTTWSGNQRMMHLAEKLAFKKEAVYRKARIVNGAYYDSVSYGILREEWDARI